ncbi:uncharacterized protein LOC113236659 [Hyposmocoma kahamanoa]|uniref:uncharacterized protein LOC113236659 n=1 Tax=Hyposmocoma kahamanoa TaxID=1477025 RepID=UPI000E6D5C74|nr:uncharacterized protein LOC113236659 [Hyposmocoma kahamanoa]
MDEYEPMDVDVTGSSASKMDVSCNDIDLSIVKKEKDFDDSSTVTSILEREMQYSKMSILKNFIKQEPDFYDTSSTMSSVVKQEKEDNVTFLSNFIKDEQNSRDTSMLKFTGATRTPVSLTYTKVKRYHINLDQKRKQNQKSLGLKAYWCIISLIILIISIITHQIIGYKCLEEIDLDMIEHKLSKNLYGQVEAVQNILKALETNEKTKILVIYGGTGVGKTFAVSMILENILSSSNVYHFTMPSFADDFSPEYLFGMTVCNNSLVVVDDLTIKDKNIKKHIEEIIDKSKDLGKRMTIILIYNCDIVTKGFIKRCNEEFLHVLKQNLHGIKTAMYYIKFNRLKLDHLIQCIITELKNLQLPLDEMMLAEILVHFNVTQDGCKSVYSKINFLTDG